MVPGNQVWRQTLETYMVTTWLGEIIRTEANMQTTLIHPV